MRGLAGRRLELDLRPLALGGGELLRLRNLLLERGRAGADVLQGSTRGRFRRPAGLARLRQLL